MPLDRLMLIIVCVISAAGATIWIVSAVLVSASISPVLALPVIGIVALAAYIGWRLLAERLTNPDENHYDKMDH